MRTLHAVDRRCATAGSTPDRAETAWRFQVWIAGRLRDRYVRGEISVAEYESEIARVLRPQPSPGRFLEPFGGSPLSRWAHRRATRADRPWDAAQRVRGGVAVGGRTRAGLGAVATILGLLGVTLGVVQLVVLAVLLFVGTVTWMGLTAGMASRRQQPEPPGPPALARRDR